MRGGLQGYILERVVVAGGRLRRGVLLGYYEGRVRAPTRKDQVHAITRALEQLIASGYLVGYGMRTMEKWFITDVRATPKANREVRKRFGQQALPFRRRSPV